MIARWNSEMRFLINAGLGFGPTLFEVAKLTFRRTARLGVALFIFQPDARSNWITRTSVCHELE